MDGVFSHIRVLVAVLNVMGLATIMAGVAGYLRKAHELKVTRDPILMTWIGLHLYFHIMLWWRMFGLDTVKDFTFFHYLFLLSGPMFLYFGSLLLLPEPDDDNVVDMPAHLGHVRGKLFLFEALFWLWAILVNPIAFGRQAPAWPFWAGMIAISIALAFARGRKASLALTLAACTLHLVFIFLIALTLGTG
jgi:hypothetical protein